MSKSTPTRPGVVLILVLVVLTISALIGTTVLAMTSAEQSAAQTSLRRTQARALAWSGVQAVMAELSNQREDILEGRDPSITEEWAVFELLDGTQGVFRLIPLGDGPLSIVSESAKLDANHASAEVLERLPMIDSALADRIVEAREKRPFRSIEELLAVDGIDADLLYGSSDPSALAFEGHWHDEDEVAALVDVLTVFSFDPNIQAGLGDEGFRHRGDLRINLNVPWSERLGRAIERRYDKNVADVVEKLKEQGTEFTDDAALVAVLRRFNVPPEDWAEILDVFTSTSDPYALGRIDLNRASRAVLRSLPGMDDDTICDEVISVREGLDDETRLSATWLAAEEVLTPDQFASCVDLVTTRSMQWRVRIEAGLLSADQQISFGADDGANPADADFASMLQFEGDEDKLMDRVVVEAVIDVSSERPRVAYMRDVTLMEVGRVIRAEMVESQSWEDRGEDPFDRGEEGAESEGLISADEAETMGNSIERGVSSEPAMNQPSGGSREPRGAGEEVRSSAGDSADEESESQDRVQDVPETGPDRRLGRWTTGQGAGR